ncbi:Apple domain-containing protein, partial [Durusdinium trenchii]
DAVEHERFGSRVSIMGRRALVTSVGNAAKNVSAAAYIFEQDAKRGWVLQARLAAPPLKNGSQFGTGLSQTEDTILIGVEEDDARGPSSGSVIVYTRNGSAWSSPEKLVAKDTAAGDHFGCSVGMSGDHAIIGAYGHSSKGKGDGAAYVFKRQGGRWVEQQQLRPEDGDANDGFGRSVSMSSNTAAIGAAGDEHNGVDKSGSGYIFVRQGTKWVQHRKLAPGKAKAGSRFGQAASISGHMATFSTASEQAFVFPASLNQVCKH